MNSGTKSTSGFSLFCQQETFTYTNFQTDEFIPVYFDENIYLIECYETLPDKQQKIHVFNLKSKQWKVFATTSKSNKSGAFFPKIGSAQTNIRNHLYCFGGKDSKSKPDTRLSILDLQKHVWKFDNDAAGFNNSTNPSPQNRINASLVAYRQRFLILYGGMNQSENQATNHMWIYDIQKCFWHKITNFIPPLINTSICISIDRLYIFGNNYQNSSQLYEFIIQPSLQSQKIPLVIEKNQNILAIDKEQISFNSGTKMKLLAHNDRILFLFQISSSKNSVTKLWLFDILTRNWQKTQIQFNREPMDIVYDDHNGFYLFENIKKPENILKIIIPQPQFKKVKNFIRHKEWKKCQICYETMINNNALMEPAFRLSKQLLDQIVEKIDFPFAAIGLFAENSFNHSATYFNVNLTTYKNESILKIEDDNHYSYTNQELEQVIVNFQAEINFNFGSVERRVRNLLTKDYMKKQFGTNLKIASLRLGSQMLYITLTPNYEARVAYFVMQSNEYVCYFYAFDQKSNKLVDDYSIQAKNYVEHKYGDLIKQSLHELQGSKYASYKNTTFIFNLKTVINDAGKTVPQLEGIFNGENKDILYTCPNPGIYKTYLEYGCKINESIDVSLASYLSLFFIKNEHLKMSIQINNGDRKLIRRQEYYESIDRNLLIRTVTPIDLLVRNFDLKSINLQFNNKLNKKMGVFHNGILLYHRNRLVKRFNCELGTLLQELQLNQKITYEHFHIFGKIELPDSLQVNQQKTDFTNPIMLQKFYSKLRYIEQLMIRNVDNEKQDIKPTNLKEGPKLRSRLAEQQEYRSIPTKKTKKNQDDESYNGN